MFPGLRNRAGSRIAKEAPLITTIALVALGFTGTRLAALGSQTEPPKLRILVNAVQGVPIDVLLRAKTETAQIYADAGVRLVWSAARTTLPLLTIMIISTPDAWRTRVGVDALGAAPAANDGSGRLAYAFYGRIHAFAGRLGIDVATVLAHVMAHELGHILLAREAHSPMGIMSERWFSFHMERIEAVSMRFTNEQAESIRQTVADMNANLK